MSSDSDSIEVSEEQPLNSFAFDDVEISQSPQSQSDSSSDIDSSTTPTPTPTIDGTIKYFSFPTRYNTPPFAVLLKHRLHSTGLGILAAIPFFIYCIIMALTIRAFFLERFKEEPRNSAVVPIPKTSYLSSPSPIDTPFSIFGDCGAGISFFAAMAVAISYITDTAKEFHTSKKIFIGFFIYVGITALTQALYAAKIIVLDFRIMWIYPFPFGIFLFQQVREIILAKNVNLAEVRKYFVTFSMGAFTFLIIVLFIYSEFVFVIFFGSDDLTPKLLFRFILHPIFMDLALIPFRWLILWLNSHSHNTTYKWGLLFYGESIYFSVAGRFLVASIPGLLGQLLTAAFLSLLDQVLRVSLLHRDSFWLRLFCGNRASHILSIDHSPLYGEFYLWDEISETIAIFTAMIFSLVLGIVDTPTAIRNSPYEIIGLALFSVIVEFGADTLRMMYYTKYVKISSTSETSIINSSTSSLTRSIRLMRFKFARFWKSVESAVHESTEERHPKFVLITSLILFFSGLYIISNIMMYHSYGRYDSKTKELDIYFGP